MSKPVLIFKMPFHFGLKSIEDTRERIKSHPISSDYHVFFFMSYGEEVVTECYNDCKGLKDEDIEKLIEDLKLKSL